MKLGIESWLCACTCAVLVGCSPESGPIGRAADRVIGGTMDTGDPAAVMVFVQSQTQEANCSGSVVSPHVVLTAAHCVDPTTINPIVAPPYNFYVYLGSDINDPSQANDPANFPRVQTTVQDPKFALTGLATGTTHDVAALIMEDAITVPALPMNREKLDSSSIGQDVRLIGYGLTTAGDTNTSGVRTEGDSTILGEDDEHVWLATGVPHGCGGDSGGPTLLNRNGVDSIIGVHSWVEHVMSCTGNQYDIRVDADALALIDPLIAMYDPGFTPPNDGSDGGGGSSSSGSSTGSGDSTGSGGKSGSGGDSKGGGAGGQAPQNTSGCSFGGAPASGAALLAWALLALAGLRCCNRATARFSRPDGSPPHC